MSFLFARFEALFRKKISMQQVTGKHCKPCEGRNFTRLCPADEQLPGALTAFSNLPWLHSEGTLCGVPGACWGAHWSADPVPVQDVQFLGRL